MSSWNDLKPTRIFLSFIFLSLLLNGFAGNCFAFLKKLVVLGFRPAHAPIADKMSALHFIMRPADKPVADGSREERD